MEKVTLPAESVPVLADVDIAVVGGSCTGVFAAVTAARLGSSVALIEKQNRFGGTATASQVCYWHSYHDFQYNKQIIFGLTHEITERLRRRGTVAFRERDPSAYVRLNTEELAIELDEIVREAKVKPFLHTAFEAPFFDDAGKLAGVVVCQKGGRGVIRARQVIDASGDGDVCAALKLPMWRNELLQPPTACAKFTSWPGEAGIHAIGQAIHDRAAEFHLPEGFVWGAYVPESDVYLLAGTKIPDLDLGEADHLTAGEIESRRQLRAIQDILGDAFGKRPVLQALPSLIGIRESKHIDSLYRLTVDDVLHGRKFDDAIACGTYRVDIHSQQPPGTRFLYLDGREVFQSPYLPREEKFWRDPSLPTPEYYSIPLRSLIPKNTENLITAGRMLDADAGAFGAVRVMVLLNQCGEAAGAAAWHALHSNCAISQVNPADVRRSLHLTC